jgi:PhzF family phenazine biosynthesis protein
MPTVPCWQVNAFTSRPFGGNPAAVCWLEQPVTDDWMQSIAAEMNLSETAYVRPTPSGLELRWFTPVSEVDLCGHATLATAHALWWAGVRPDSEPLRFHTKSGLLTCTRATDSSGHQRIELDFPATPATPCDPPPGLFAALGLPDPAADQLTTQLSSTVLHVGRTRFDLLVVLESAARVRTLRPDYALLREFPIRGVIVTARSDDATCDFQSRFFAPAVGVDEDPVCGSAHCALAPYWGELLGQTNLFARQVSRRGGDLWLRRDGDRVVLGGEAVTIWQGQVLV